MTIGIYCIRHVKSNKRYIGKSINIEKRFTSHKHYLTRLNRRNKDTNRHLHNAVMKYGWCSFELEVLEKFDTVDESLMSDCELKWMDLYNTCNRKFGYNLRRDSSTKMITHDETKTLQSKVQSGSGNGNFGVRWTNEAKEKMSKLKKQQHLSGVYDDEWKSKIGKASSAFWLNNPVKKKQMAEKVAKKKKKYKFRQLNEDMTVVKVWDSVDDIIAENPEWKWQNIYSVCNGHKKRIYGYKWEKVEL